MPELNTYTSDITSSTDIELELNTPTDIDCMLFVKTDDSVIYIGSIDSTVDIEQTAIGKDFSGKMIVTNPYEPVEYDAFIGGNLDINKETIESDIESSTDLEKATKDIDINSTTNIDKVDVDVTLMYISAYLDNPLDSVYDILNGTLQFVPNDQQYDIACQMVVPTPYPSIDIIDGTVSIDSNGFEHILPSYLSINGITDMHDIYAEVQSMPDYINGVVIDCDFKYENTEMTTDIFSFFYLDQGLSRAEFNCQMKVPRNQYIYSIYSFMHVVPRVDTDIPCTMTVFNDQIYDLNSFCFIALEKQNTDLITGDLTLPPFDTMTFDANVELEKIDTRKDFMQGYMYVVQPVNTDFTCYMNVETPYVNGIYDIPSKMNVGYSLMQDMFYGSINVLNATLSTTEFMCTLNIDNPLMPARIGIFVDPLWEFEPYVLKSSLVTFLDRIYTKNILKIIYGGNPRANWDIHHFADVFSVRPDRQIEVPMDFNPRDPIYNRDEMYRFIRTLFTFSDDDTHRYVDRVLVFTNTPYTHRTVMMSPLLDMCHKYHIPCVCITSKGEFIEATVSNNNTITVDSNNPIDQQPHWSYGPNSKHRTVFDTNDIV